MAYHLEGKDIVINGFEKGISDSVYSGVADMRNVEIISVPGEASVTFGTTAVTQPPVMNAVAFTATASNDTLTVSSTTGLYAGAAIVLNTNTAGGISTGTAYYVQNLTSTTFTLSLGPGITTAVNITSDGAGTFTTYQFGGQIVAYYADTTGSLSGVNAVFVSDNSGHLWFFFSSTIVNLPANTLIFAGNIGGIAASVNNGNTGINIWNGYIFLFGIASVGTDICKVNTLLTSTATSWTYLWQTLDTRTTGSRINTLVSVEDGNLYWCSSQGLGSLIETPGSTFNPANSATYTLNNGDALLFPETDKATCLAELSQNILIGGLKNFVYVWNKVDPGFSDLLNVPDSYTKLIVAASQNAYVFAGTRGRIYITNGSGMDLYKKVPDYVTGFQLPLFTWQDASFGRNQLYFGYSIRDAANTQQGVDAGLWAVDMDTDAMRLLNKTSDAAYSGFTVMVTPRPGDNSTSETAGIVGNDIAIGSYNLAGSAARIDVSSSTPYTNYESYLQTEIIPVGTFLDPFTPSQLEFKLSAPMVAGEGVRISYRTNITANFTLLGETTTAGSFSDVYKSNFEKAQWVQFLVELKSTGTNPSYTRLTEIRIRDWPSGVNSNRRPVTS